MAYKWGLLTKQPNSSPLKIGVFPPGSLEMDRPWKPHQFLVADWLLVLGMNMFKFQK